MPAARNDDGATPATGGPQTTRPADCTASPIRLVPELELPVLLGQELLPDGDLAVVHQLQKRPAEDGGDQVKVQV